ncbi:hypothetical protein SprV_0401607900 [Sparganum proliferum]
MRHQPDNIYLFSRSRHCCKPCTDRHPVAALPPPSDDTLRPAPTPVSTTTITTTTTTTTTTITTATTTTTTSHAPPTDAQTSDVA